MTSVPHAEVVADGEFMIGLQTNNLKYKLYDEGNRPANGDEKIYSVNIGFVKHLNLVVNLIRIDGASKEDSIGIGDRSAQLTFLAFRETDKFPSVAVNFSVPNLSNEQQFLSGNHLVATKKFILENEVRLKTTLGFGIPYLIGGLGEDNDRKLTVRDKQSQFLTGVFGGLELQLDKLWNASIEYDGRTWNGEIGALVWNRLGISIYAQGFSRMEYALNYSARIK